MNLTEVLHDGSPWLVLVCVLMFAGIVIGLFTDRGSGIGSHPFTKAGTGGQLASDLPPESLGRPEFEPVLKRRRRDS